MIRKCKNCKVKNLCLCSRCEKKCKCNNEVMDWCIKFVGKEEKKNGKQ